jgi:hypothetical protein
MRQVFSPTPNAAKVAALLAREAELRKGARRVVGLRRRDRAVIETELGVVRRLLEQLGYRAQRVARHARESRGAN